jgi:hypothetical protein
MKNQLRSLSYLQPLPQGWKEGRRQVGREGRKEARKEAKEEGKEGAVGRVKEDPHEKGKTPR